MAKALLTDYAFVPGAAGDGTITVPGTYALNQFLLVTNVTTGTVIYQFNAPAKGATLSVAGGSTTLTLEFNTSSMSAGHSLQIFADTTTGSSANTVLSGSGAPAAGTGSNGDFYIDTAAPRIYGPKASGAWGSGTTMVGTPGSNGAAATISVGSVTTGAAGSSASVSNTGTSSAAVLAFSIPRGDTGATGSTGNTGPAGAAGAAATISVGSVTTGAAGSSASVSNTGTSSAAVLAFSIPRGDTGATGATGSAGATGPSGVVAATAPITYNSGTQTVAITAATTSAAGSMSSADKAKLDGIASGAQVNVATDLSYTASTRLLESSTGTDVTLPLVTSSNAGLAPASGGGTTTFLRADGTWSTAGSPPGGSDTQLQFNDGGAFGGDADLVYNKTTNLLTTKGDVRLDDGGTFTTTLQCITPTAARTISLPDATGTVGLVAGSSGQLVWNNAGAYAGVAASTVDSSGNITLGARFTSSLAGAASTPPVALTGTWFTGGTATTTKPQVLIEPTGATSTAWSTSGTGLGVNAASGFAGNLLDLQVNGTSQLSVLGSALTVNTVRFGGNANNTLSGGGLNIDSNISLSPGLGVIKTKNTGTVEWSSTTNTGGVSDVILLRDAANSLAQRNGTAAQTKRVYNTYTSGTNYELGKLEWSGNVFRIGTEKGSGGGTARAVEVHTDSISRLALDTTGSVRVVTALTVATLPGTPAVGMIARVTDATAPAVGVTVTGGGAAAALVWYNGANWSVLGV